MAAAAAALIRSVSSKIARASPHHRLLALGLGSHGPRPALRNPFLGSFRTVSTQTNRKVAVRDFGCNIMWNRTNTAFFLLFCAMIYTHSCMSSAFQEIKDSFAAASREELKFDAELKLLISQHCDRIRDIYLERGMLKETEFQAQRTQTSVKYGGVVAGAYNESTTLA